MTILRISRKTAVILLTVWFTFSTAVFSQKIDSMKFVSVDGLMLTGQGFAESHVKYGRLPAAMGKVFRPDLYGLGTNSAGIAVRFSSNSRAIAVRWTVRGNGTMNHMASTGIKGFDLYSLDRGKWYYAGTAIPEAKTSVRTVAQNMSGDMREYIAYFPLYDGVESVEIGVEQDAVIGKPVDNALTKRQEAKPVVFYGTSITQGGCASRPGMAYPAILGRMLNRETVNLGFSGNGKLDFSLAEAISRIDAEAVVIDCLPNNTAQTVRDSAYRFITHIARTKPAMKIFMLEHPENPLTRFNLNVRQKIAETNREWKTLYSRLKNEGFQQIVYIDAYVLTDSYGETTVDGVHFTDLGFLRYAEALFPYLSVFSSPPYGQNLHAESETVPSSLVREYTERFNKTDDELTVQMIPNSKAADFLIENIPRFECPDKQLEEIYYFRWWTYRKHIKQTPDGYIITEFLPAVPWAGKYNGISCPAMHHYNEGRWLHNRAYLDSYAHYWLRGGGSLRTYTFPIACALYDYYLVTDDDALLKTFLPDLIANFGAWEKERYDESKRLFWQDDGRDGMEVSVCGKETAAGYRVTINSGMIAEAKTIAAIAKRLDSPSGDGFGKKADALHTDMLQTLWDRDARFFKVIPKKEGAGLCDARELHGYTPWYFSLAGEEYAEAWKFLMDSTHFYAPYGPATAERCHPGFRVSYEGHECQWNGPSWPFATSVTLTALANLLNEQQQNFISSKDYFDLLKIFAKSHYLTGDDGVTVPWIDENLNPFTGDWIARTRLKTWENGTWSKGKGGVERGKDYNHSTFCDLVISGLIGIRPQEGSQLTVNPLVPADTWDYFCMDNVIYKGHKLTVLYDKTGRKYNRGKGLRVFVDGVLKGKSDKIEKLTIN
jgi:hypothetical protein